MHFRDHSWSLVAGWDASSRPSLCPMCFLEDVVVLVKLIWQLERKSWRAPWNSWKIQLNTGRCGQLYGYGSNTIHDISNNYGSFSWIQKTVQKTNYTTPVWQETNLTFSSISKEYFEANIFQLQRGYVDFIPQHVALKHGNPSGLSRLKPLKSWRNGVSKQNIIKNSIGLGSVGVGSFKYAFG